MPDINSTRRQGGRFGNYFFHNMAGHVIAKQNNLKFEYGEVEKNGTSWN